MSNNELIPVASPGATAVASVGMPSQLTDKQEAFAVAYHDTGNMTIAYRRAYNVSPMSKPGWVYNEASKMAAHPGVARRVRALQEATAAEGIASKAQLINFLWRRILADRSKLIRRVVRNCRCCYGVGHKYQWKDTAEWAEAYAKVMDENAGLEPALRKPFPDDAGGFGFDAHREPNPDCDVAPCMGEGHGTTVITDTSKLEGDATLIYEGIKETAQGIEVKLADRSSDINLLLKVTGWAVSDLEGMLRGAAAGGAAGAVAAQAVVEKVKTMDSEDTRRAYLTMIGGT